MPNDPNDPTEHLTEDEYARYLIHLPGKTREMNPVKRSWLKEIISGWRLWIIIPSTVITILIVWMVM